MVVRYKRGFANLIQSSDRSMKKLGEFVLGRLITGVLVVAPIYLAVLLLLKGMKSLTGGA